MSFASTYSVLPSGSATSRHDAVGLLILEGGCPLFVDGQIITWVKQYCAGIKPFRSGVTHAIMYASSDVKHLVEMDPMVRENLAVHFGSIKIFGAYGPATQKYREDVIHLDTRNRNVLHLLSNEFVDGMLHDWRFSNLENDACLDKAWEEAFRIVAGISVPKYHTMSGHYKVNCTTVFAGKIHPQPTVRTITQLREIWEAAERIIGPMPTHDPHATALDHDLVMKRTGEFWGR